MINSKYFTVYKETCSFLESYKDLEREYPLEWEYLHMTSTAQLGRMLAIKRNYDQDIAAIACLLHDLGRVVTGKQEGHASYGSEPSTEILVKSGFKKPMIESIVCSVINHGKKDETGEILDEIVKDADVIDCALYGLYFEKESFRKRLLSLELELDLPSLGIL